MTAHQWLSEWLATGEHGTNLARAQLNDRHTEILRCWLPDLLPPSGLLADLADCVSYYAQVAAREAVRGGDGNGPAPVIGYLIDGKLWHPSDVTIVRQGA